MFTSNVAQTHEVKKPEPVAKERLSCFDTQLAKLQARLEQSLSDARGRYNEDGSKTDRSYGKSKPSKNWRVVNKVYKADEQEQVEVFLQVGKPLVEVNGKLRTRLPAVQLVPWLEEQLANVETLKTADRSSGVGEWFKLLAKAASKPTTDKSVWEYDEGTDLWNKVRDLSDEEVAANRAAKEAAGNAA